MDKTKNILYEENYDRKTKSRNGLISRMSNRTDVHQFDGFLDFDD